MKTLKFSICLILAQMAMMAASAQTMTTTDSLMRYKWVSQIDFTDSEVGELYYIFDLDTIKYVIVYDKNYEDYDPTEPELLIENQYYVSATKDTSFRQSEVGKKRNGQFVIIKRMGDEFDVYEIIELEDKNLVLKYYGSDDTYKHSYWTGVPKEDKRKIE
jgi:hypothetical protein